MRFLNIDNKRYPYQKDLPTLVNYYFANDLQNHIWILQMGLQLVWAVSLGRTKGCSGLCFSGQKGSLGVAVSMESQQEWMKHLHSQWLYLEKTFPSWLVPQIPVEILLSPGMSMWPRLDQWDNAPDLVTGSVISDSKAINQNQCWEKWFYFLCEGRTEKVACGLQAAGSNLSTNGEHA
jgi:hypothetical protein